MIHKHIQLPKFLFVITQWAFGVTCWEIFSGGMVPYAGISVADLPEHIQVGRQLAKPNNDACSDEV